MKKILGIFVASAAALGSAMIAAPAHAQSAILPVTVEITPAIYLRTYQDLKFIVSAQDLVGGRSVEQIGSYDEKAGTTTLPTTTPIETPTQTVTKRVPVLFQIWGGSTNPDIDVNVTKSELRTQGGSTGGITGGSATTPVTMAVTEGTLTSMTNSASPAVSYKQAGADFTFTFPNSNIPQNTVFTGGEVTIQVVTP